MSVVLEISGLKKVYRYGFAKRNSVVAVDGLNLAVRRGEILGFLGPNGAGKTTTIKMTMGFLKPTDGKISVLGESAQNWWVRNSIGFLPENPSIYPYLNGYQALMAVGRMFSLNGRAIRQRIESLSEQLGLDRELKIPLQKHSKGMTQRIGLAQALINNPDLVILDEPMSGLDPIGRKMFRETIMKLKSEGKTVFFSSHILSDIEMLCDRVTILNRGKLIMDAKMADILKQQNENNGKTLEQIFMEKVGAAS